MLHPNSCLVAKENPYGGTCFYEIVEAHDDGSAVFYMVRIWFEVPSPHGRFSLDISLPVVLNPLSISSYGKRSDIFLGIVDDTIHEAYREFNGSSVVEEPEDTE